MFVIIPTGLFSLNLILDIILIGLIISCIVCLIIYVPRWIRKYNIKMKRKKISELYDKIDELQNQTHPNKRKIEELRNEINEIKKSMK